MTRKGLMPRGWDSFPLKAPRPPGARIAFLSPSPRFSESVRRSWSQPDIRLPSEKLHASCICSHLSRLSCPSIGSQGRLPCPRLVFHAGLPEPARHCICIYHLPPRYRQSSSQPWISLKFMIGPQLAQSSLLDAFLLWDKQADILKRCMNE